MASKDNTLNKYLLEKSPFLHNVEFNLSLKEYPLNPVLLPLPLDSKLLDYDTNALEVLYRWMNLQNLNCQVDLDEILDYELDKKNDNAETSDQNQVDEPLDLTSVLPTYILEQVKTTEPVKNFQVTNLIGTKKETATLASDSNTQGNWLRLSKEQRVQAYMNSICNSFVDPKTLVNPKNPNLKQKKVYKIMPNVQCWKNNYIHASISGGVAEIDKGEKGFMKVTEKTVTSKHFECYHSVGMEGDSERFAFIRNYTCQHSAKGSFNENYYLMSMPKHLYQLLSHKVDKKNAFHPQTQQISQENNSSSTIQDDSDSDIIHILSIKGQKSVLTKAGGSRKSDYLITYQNEEQVPSD